MTNADNVKSKALMFNLLAEIFYRNPDEDLKETISELDTSLFITNRTSSQGPVLILLNEIKRLATEQPLVELKQDFNGLFIRPKGKFAYPWGSVYLNKQNRLFDLTTLAFMEFCKKYQLNFTLEQNEPVDHFSLMLVALIHCMELDDAEEHTSLNDFNESLCEHPEANRTATLLKMHLLPWSGRFLELVNEHSTSGLYRAAATLSQLLLDDLKQDYKITVEPVQLYK
ncbi:molecular chaperone TorD family protein [Shewanella sp. 1_MG-2023]|uniref:TorD/DmsD family molecular chaperone n=1 Tax=unclassified Shewanella TaxID=196818 RepID=UPI0026E383FA|nr:MULTISPECIES: molecular chaperone TorD family protein [unclassified Shewanella]MDO6611012.1 molecular chaperone TorD family protein [Shewanella sp. 7_MG-2023]MDO6770137.1 molecular chaperone TorD family protein [Shewanella sp. 2_MG-2023]MDO6794751.1 molecular chaperone TorD family protein [Shewanella sp. 1_MG-2023]